MKIIICPGSAQNQKFKRWPVKKFVELARLSELHGMIVLIILGPEEQDLVNIFLQFNTIQSASFDELKSLSDDVDLVVCNDSFLLHFFSIINKKVLALYGPTDPNRTLPPNAYKLTSKLPSSSRPCWGSKLYGKCDNGRCSCFDKLEANDVFNKALSILSI